MILRRLRGAGPLLLAAALLMACGGGRGGGGSHSSAPPPVAPSSAELDFASDVFDRVNEQRTAQGLVPLVNDPDAADAAYAHAYDMETRGFFDHDNPSGENPGARLARAGVAFSGWGENIARGQSTPDDVMAAWMASDGHRRNILDPAFRRLGVGVRRSADGPWWVQDFVEP